MKKYVQIQSELAIGVTPGLQNNNVTNPSANIPDRLKVNPSWPKAVVEIKVGKHWYPSEITEWNTVKALVKDGKMTIGEFSDECDDQGVVIAAENLDRELQKMKKTTKKASKETSLNDLAEGE